MITLAHADIYSQRCASISKELLSYQEIIKNTCTLGRQFIQTLLATQEQANSNISSHPYINRMQFSDIDPKVGTGGSHVWLGHFRERGKYQAPAYSVSDKGHTVDWNPNGVSMRSMEFIRWYNPSQAYTVNHVSYQQLTATILISDFDDFLLKNSKFTFNLHPSTLTHYRGGEIATTIIS